MALFESQQLILHDAKHIMNISLICHCFFISICWLVMCSSYLLEYVWPSKVDSKYLTLKYIC